MASITNLLTNLVFVSLIIWPVCALVSHFSFAMCLVVFVTIIMDYGSHLMVF